MAGSAHRAGVLPVVALAATAASWAACGSKAPPSRPPPPAPVLQTPAQSVDPELLAQLTVLATGARPTAGDLEKARATPTVAAYIEKLVNDPRLGREVVARFTFRELLATPGASTIILSYTLKRADGEGAPLYYLRQPCARAQAVAVRPWWDMDADVLVCPDSYQPDRWRIVGPAKRFKSGELAQHCNSLAGSPFLETAPYCGCGPNLIRCYRDKEHARELVTSMKGELVETVGHIVDQDLPASDVFTSQASFRDRNVEFLYRQWAMEDEQRADPEALRSLRDWPKEGRWAPRAERAQGQHAGVITAPRLIHEHSDRRQRMRDIYDKLWCSKPTSVGATVQMVLSLRSKNLQIKQEGWQELAARPLCTDCHARLDYGWQFMLGWGDGRVNANHFVTAFQPVGQVGPLYGKNINDRRGEGPLDTRTFAALAVAQPEFRQCMVGNVARHVFGHDASRADVAALEAAFELRPTFRSLMREALTRYAAAWRAPAAPLAAPAAPAGPAARMDPIVIAPALRGQLEEYCTDCHGEGGEAKAWDFEPEALPRSLVVRMLDQVAWGRMPRRGGLDGPVRYALVNAFVDTLWDDPKARSVAVRHYLGRMESLPVHGPSFARNIVGSLVVPAPATPGQPWTLLEEGLAPDELTFTPGFAAFTGLEALERCKAAGHRGEALERCLEGATRPEVLSKGRIPPAEK